MKESVTGCSIEEAMRLLGGRWRLLLVSYLIDGPRRFNELRRDVPHISQRMLTPALAAQEIIPGSSTKADIEAAFGKAAITTYANGQEVWLYQLGLAKLVDSLPYVNLVLSSADNKKELSILFNRAGIVKKYQLMDAPL